MDCRNIKNINKVLLQKLNITSRNFELIVGVFRRDVLSSNFEMIFESKSFNYNMECGERIGELKYS